MVKKEVMNFGVISGGGASIVPFSISLALYLFLRQVHDTRVSMALL